MNLNRRGHVFDKSKKPQHVQCTRCGLKMEYVKVVYGAIPTCSKAEATPASLELQLPL